MEHQISSLVLAHAEPYDIADMFNEVYQKCRAVRHQATVELLVCGIHAQHKNLVHYLLNSDDFKVDLNYKYGVASPSPLHAAVKVGRTEFVDLLLKHGASVNLHSRATVELSSEVCTAIELALSADRLDILSILEPSFCDDNYTLLHIACLHGAYHCTAWLLNLPNYQTVVDQLDKRMHKCTALMLALRHGVRLTKLLLSYGATASIVSPNTRQTALHHLVSRENYTATVGHFISPDFVDVLRILIEAGCEVNATDSSGYTALSLLCMHPYTEAIVVSSTCASKRCDVFTHRRLLLDATTLLLDSGAKTNLLDCDGNTPLDILMRYVKLIVMCNSKVPEAKVSALMTSCDLLLLIGSRCDAVFSSSSPAKDAVSLLQTITTSAERMTALHDDENADAFSVIGDICGFLLTVCPQTELLSALELIASRLCSSSLHHHHPFVVSLATSLINVSTDLAPVYKVVSAVSETMSSTAHNARETEQQKAVIQLLLELLYRPRSLKQTCRLVILNQLQPKCRFRHIHYLGLPQDLVQYLCSLDK